MNYNDAKEISKKYINRNMCLWLILLYLCSNMFFTCILYGNTNLKVKRISAIDQKPCYIIAMSPASDSKTLLIGLSDQTNKTIKTDSMVQILSFNNVDISPIDFDACIDYSSNSLILLAGRRLGGAIYNYQIYAYLLNMKSLKTRQYKSQIHKTVQFSQKNILNQEFYMPLDIRKVLIASLDPGSPIQDKTLPSIRIKYIKNVLLSKNANGRIMVKGTINDRWQFVLPIVLDNKNEKITTGKIQLYKI